jgi:hypothetical protein
MHSEACTDFNCHLIVLTNRVECDNLPEDGSPAACEPVVTSSILFRASPCNCTFQIYKQQLIFQAIPVSREPTGPDYEAKTLRTPEVDGIC